MRCHWNSKILCCGILIGMPYLFAESILKFKTAQAVPTISTVLYMGSGFSKYITVKYMVILCYLLTPKTHFNDILIKLLNHIHRLNCKNKPFPIFYPVSSATLWNSARLPDPKRFCKVQSSYKCSSLRMLFQYKCLMICDAGFMTMQKLMPWCRKLWLC